MKPGGGKAKGTKAENDVLKILEDELNWKLTRNKNQSARGGRDLSEDTDRHQQIINWSIEIKHQARESLNQWWAQTVRQAMDCGRKPVLFYRGNRQPWRVALAPNDINPSAWPVRRDESYVILSLRDGLQFLREES